MPKSRRLERPTKKSEYTICCASVGGEKGWRDLVATIRGPLANSWDSLTRTPTDRTPTK